MTIDFKSFIIGMGFGIGLVIVIVPLVQGIINFILDLIELLSNYLKNKGALNASKVQAKIDSLDSSNTSAIGFQYTPDKEYEGDEDE